MKRGKESKADLKEENAKLKTELRDCAHALAKEGCDPTKPLVPQIEALVDKYHSLCQRLEDNLVDHHLDAVKE